MIKDKSWKKTFTNAINGVLFAFGTQRNFKIHLLISLSVIFFSWILKITRVEFLLIIMAIIFGLVIEMANTAFEKTVDLVTEEFNPKAKIAKDVSAGMMLVVSIGLTIMAVLIFIPHLL
jgi:diacylglycerol kinase